MQVAGMLVEGSPQAIFAQGPSVVRVQPWQEQSSEFLVGQSDPGYGIPLVTLSPVFRYTKICNFLIPNLSRILLATGWGLYSGEAKKPQVNAAPFYLFIFSSQVNFVNCIVLSI